MKYSGTTLLILIVIAALLLKIFQHNRLLHLTYTQQRLARQQTKLRDDCINLRTQLQRDASYETVYQHASRNGMKPVQLPQIVPLSVALKGDHHAAASTT
ncbi:MAG: hypothetical protein PVJ92_02145 [Candidatus Dependentiae bacterium]|jgi:hypothetical protein